MSTISDVHALEILDSRGVPTLYVTVILEDGHAGAAAVPSGASTGIHEAVELRDGDKSRYRGKGVRQAVANVEGEIAHLLIGRDPADQAGIDRDLIALDGTPNKSRLGANAILGASMAIARASSAEQRVPLYYHLGGPAARLLPLPMMNVINGGKHADNGLEFQEFMIVPHGAPSFGEALRYAAETFRTLGELIHDRGMPATVGDEGGYAPNLHRNEEACDLIVEAIEASGYRPGEDISIALDPAASSFREGAGYTVPSLQRGPISGADLLGLYSEWVGRFPIVSIEDGFAEEDWESFARQTADLGDRVQIVGDDIFVTNPEFIARGIAEQTANAALIKLNQIGTVTETIEAIQMCRNAGWRYVISHRSGETEDPFIADFAVAMGGGQIKSGSLSRSERLAKYNRLLAIERELGADAHWNPPLPLRGK